MKELPEIETDDDVVAEACGWVAQLETGDLSSADLAALREWMHRSPRHRAELISIAQLSGEFSILTDMDTALGEALGVDSDLRKRRPRFFQRRGAVSAATACAFTLLIAITVIAILPTQNMPEIYATQTGEYETVNLADGSIVKLNTKTQLEVEYSRDFRRLRLIEGEAFFEVAKDADRPFVVYSGDTVTRAIGTSFAVRVTSDNTELSVLEGAVEFYASAESFLPNIAPILTAPDASEHVDVRIVEAGQAAVVTRVAVANAPKQTDLLALTPRDIQRKVSWTEGLLDFSQTPLATVADEFSRHNGIQITVEDPTLRDVAFGGIFRTNDVDLFIEALEQMDIQAERSENEVRLVRMGHSDVQ